MSEAVNLSALAELRKDLREDFAAIRSEIAQGRAELRTEIQLVRTEIQQLRGDTRDDMRVLLQRQDRQFLWLLSIMLGSWASLLGVILMRH